MTYLQIPINLHKNIYLEEVKVISQRLVKSNQQEPGSAPPKLKIKAGKRLKRMSFCAGAKTSWYDVFNKGQGFFLSLVGFQQILK